MKYVSDAKYNKYKKSCYKEEGDQLFSVSTGDRARSNGLKLQEKRFRLERRMIF